MSDFIDPYIDPETGILRNKLGAKTAEELRVAEGNVTCLAEVDWGDVPHTRDLAELKSIHKKLFEGVYDWAGELRTVNIRKRGWSDFLDYPFLENGANYVFDGLKKENFLQGLPREKFIERLAYFYDQLNFVHPFREGNGRVQRIFWQRLAKDAGYEIFWETAGDDEINEASIAGKERQDLYPLKELFNKIVANLDSR